MSERRPQRRIDADQRAAELDVLRLVEALVDRHPALAVASIDRRHTPQMVDLAPFIDAVAVLRARRRPRVRRRAGAR